MPVACVVRASWAGLRLVVSCWAGSCCAGSCWVGLVDLVRGDLAGAGLVRAGEEFGKFKAAF